MFDVVWKGTKMPEGQAIHRLARLINERFEGSIVSASSPQGRFIDGARRLNGLVARRAEAWGKHFFMPFTEEEQKTAPSDGIWLGDDGPVWLHIHLGLYGRWYFTGENAEAIAGAGIRSGNHHAINLGEGSTVRLRLVGDSVAADLTGPSRCEILDGPGVRAAIAKLGPDPVRNDPGDRERFVRAVRGRKTPVGQLILDQSVAAGPGNIYRADCLFRVGISPLRPGNRVSPTRLGALWDDLAATMQADVPDGVIRTVPEDLRPEPVKAATGQENEQEEDAEAQRFAVYHRTGRPCLRCGTAIAEKEMAGRRLFWCPKCQR